MDNRPIGVFDSGFGGLTVVKELIKVMPNESIVYFGDNNRAPYGVKTKDVILKYALQNIKFLLSKDVKAVVIACNTASASGIKELAQGFNFSLEESTKGLTLTANSAESERSKTIISHSVTIDNVINEVSQRFNVPLVEVIGPGSIAVANKTRIKRVGVIGTSVTINSRSYERNINKIDKDIKVFSIACPLFVPLVEEGWWEDDIGFLVASKYLNLFNDKQIDTLLLGCTHYPLLEKSISRFMGDSVNIVNSSQQIALTTWNVIKSNRISASDKNVPIYNFYTSGFEEKFMKIGSSILGKQIQLVERVDIEKY